MIAYLDASAAVKLILEDEGASADLKATLESAGTVATSRLTYVETRAALAAARRSGRLAPVKHDMAVSSLDVMWFTMLIVELTPAVASDAGSVSETFGLRAGDAVQLASMRALAATDASLVAWDGRLRAAATASGFACYPFEV